MTKPKCADFIVAAIRQIRYNPSNLKEGTKAGVAINRLWSVVSEAYTEGEFRRAVKGLIKKEIIVATWRFGKRPGREHRACRVASIPARMPLERKWWCRHRGKFMEYDQIHSENYESIRNFMFYVVADGLPQRIQLPMRSTNKTADEIIAAMRKSRR